MGRLVPLLVCSLTVMASTVAAAPPAHSDNPSLLHRVMLDLRWHTASFVEGHFSVPGPSMEASARSFVKAQETLFKIERPDQELRLMRQAIDKLGKSHVRFNQVYRGLRVWGRELIVHFDTPNTIYLAGGQIIPTPHLQTTPQLSSTQAIHLAVESADSVVGRYQVSPKSELLIYPDDSGQTHLAWLITLVGIENYAIRYQVFVDAISGKVLLKYNDVQEDGPAIGSGPDVNLNIRTLQTYQFGAAYKLLDASRAMYQPPVENMEGVIVTCNAMNGYATIQDPNGDNIFDDSASYRAAVAGHYYAGLTYEYYLNTFGRNSLDDNGLRLKINVHDQLMINNAYYEGDSNTVNFGDGDGINYLPWSGSLDIVAHELTHGVTFHSANLLYTFQSGALNESFSDFFGAMVDTDDWWCGEEIRITEPGFLRSLENPHEGPIRMRFPFGFQPMVMSEYVDTVLEVDNGGVHINSGIPNHVGYLVGSTISRAKAEQIWYRTLTVYLTPSSDFNFWAAMTLQSTIDLFGDPSTELTAVTNALDSVGFGLLVPTPQAIDLGAVAFGTTKDTDIVVVNRRPETVSWTSISSAKGALALVTNGPTNMVTGDTLRITATASAVGLTSCDLGTIEDTIVLTTTCPAVPTLNMPVKFTYSYFSVSEQARTVATSCMTASLNNKPSINDFAQGGSDILYKASLIVTYVDGLDTVMYADIYPSYSFSTVDSLITGTVGTDQTRTLRFASNDSRLQGKVVYQYEPTDMPGCGYIAAEYWLTNVCSSPLTIYSGLVGDFDIGDDARNYAGFDATNRLVYVRDSANSIAGALAMLSGTPRNLRALNNNPFYFSSSVPGRAFSEMNATSSVAGSSPADWSALLTFGQNTLAAGDSVRYRVALLYSTAGSNGLATILAEVNGPSCCIGTTGNVNMSGITDLSDLSLLIAYLTVTPKPTLPCPDEANVNGVGIIDLSDLSLLIAYLTTTPKPTLPDCPE